MYSQKISYFNTMPALYLRGYGIIECNRLYNDLWKFNYFHSYCKSRPIDGSLWNSLDYLWTFYTHPSFKHCATSCVITFWCLEKMKMFLWPCDFFCRGRRWGVEANYAYLIPTWSINSTSSRERAKSPLWDKKENLNCLLWAW